MANGTNITKFQHLGIQNQTDSDSVQEAVNAFKMSCKICTRRGINVPCDQCPIKAAHELTLAVFADLKAYDEMKAANACSAVPVMN